MSGSGEAKDRLDDDVTRLREQVSESQDLYHLILDSISDAVFLTDDAGAFTFVCSNVSRIFGYSPQQLRELGSISHLFGDHLVDPDELRAAGEIVNLERSIRDKAGRERVLLVNVKSVAIRDSTILYVCRDITERKKSEDVLRNVAEGVSAATGDEFFRFLVRYLAQMLEVDYAYVAQVIGGVWRARTLAFWARGEIADNFEYDLAHTPCENVAERGIYCCPQGVQQQFPQDHLLVELGVESYAGTPLRGSDGRVLGVMVILDGQPMEDVAHVKSLLQIFAIRASGELERKLAEEALQKERDRAQQYLDIAGVMLVVLDSRGEIVLMNRRGYAILGYEEGELLGKNWFDTCVPPQLRPQVRDVFQQLMAGSLQPVEYFENAVLTRTGEERIIAWHNTTLADERGQPVGTLSSGEDVTQRRQAETALRRRQEQLEALQQVGLEITAQLDLDVVLHSIVFRAIELLNASAGGFYLYQPEREVLEWVVAVGPNLAPVGATLRPGQGLSGKVWQRGKPLIVEDYAVWDGRSATYEDYVFAAVVGVPVYWGSADAQREFLGVLDILDSAPRSFTPADTELLTLLASQAAIAIKNARLFQAEQQRRQEAEALRQAASALGSTLDLEEVLERILEQVTHVLPGDGIRLMLIERDAARVVRWRGYERFGMDAKIKSLVLPLADFPTLSHMRDTGEAVFISDTTRDPRWVRMPEADWLRSYAAAPIHGRDQLIGFLAVDSAIPGFYTSAHAQHLKTFAIHAGLALQNAQLYQDLQERMAELREAQSQLVQSAKMAAVGQLAAGVAHELNNPLTAVLGFAELLTWKMQPGDPDWQDLNAIAEEARRARNIVRDLLDFARQSGSTAEPSDINELLVGTLALLRRQLANDNVELVEDYALGLPALTLSANGIKQTFLNLISNALQAMPSGGTLTVRTEQIGGEVAVHIADTGTGIPDEALPHIFEPFFTTKPVGQGTGLGLSVSLGIVQDHGGRITVRSRLAEGTLFTVWLPIDPGTLAPDPESVL